LSMQDLQALAKQQDWSEVLASAQRVEPGARTTAWNGLVRAAAVQLVAAVVQTSSSDVRAAQRLADLAPDIEGRYTFLLADKSYLQAKAQLLSRVVDDCIEQGLAGCGDAVERLADGIDKFPSGAARAIALMLSDERSPAHAIRFWALAIDDDPRVCRTGGLERATLAVLANDEPGPRLADAQKAAGRCYAALEPVLVKALIASDETAKPRPAFLRHACPLLKTHGKLTVLKRRKCP